MTKIKKLTTEIQQPKEEKSDSPESTALSTLASWESKSEQRIHNLLILFVIVFTLYFYHSIISPIYTYERIQTLKEPVSGLKIVIAQ